MNNFQTEQNPVLASTPNRDTHLAAQDPRKRTWYGAMRSGASGRGASGRACKSTVVWLETPGSQEELCDDARNMSSGSLKVCGHRRKSYATALLSKASVLGKSNITMISMALS